MKLRKMKQTRFTVIDNECLKTDKLSLKAKGLLVIMLSRPDNWEFSIKGLMNFCNSGERVITSAIDELKKAGYLTIRKLFPNETESKKIEYEYVVSDEVQKPEQDPQNIEQDLQNQGLQNQGLQNVPLDIYNITKYCLTKERSNNTPINAPTENDKTASDDAAPAAPKGGVNETVRTVISYLNEKTGKRFSPRSAMAVRHITARLKEGYALEDFKTVIDKKVAAWKGDERMAQYLRPETLFGSKFDGYLNEVTAPKSYKAVKNETYDYAEWERTHDEFGNPIGDTR